MTEMKANCHKCATCGHVWESIDDKTAKDVRTAAQVNGQGPYCGLCMHLEIARRYAEAQGYSTFKEAVNRWIKERSGMSEDKDQSQSVADAAVKQWVPQRTQTSMEKAR